PLAEGANTDRQPPISGREGVDDRRLQATGSRRGEQDDLMLGLEEMAKMFQYLSLEGGVFRASMIDHLLAAGPPHGGWKRGGPRDPQVNVIVVIHGYFNA